MRNLKTTISLIVLLLAASTLFYSCKKKDDVTKAVISIKGSDTMVNLAQKWAEVYMQQNPDVSIQVTGGGSGTGVAALLNGTTDIATSSRELKPKEIELAKSKNILYSEIEVALDGLALIVHPSNPIDSLTINQVRDLFIGKINNFKKVKGQDITVTLYGRENSSGTYEFFKDHVLGKDEKGRAHDFASSTQVLQGTSALAEAVARDKAGIAYGGVGYFAHRNDVKILHIKKDEMSPAIAPAENNIVDFEVIWNGTYSISRPLFLYVADSQKESIKKFIEFIVSAEGQKLVGQMEYIPLPEKK